jgi:hypothetical protein
VVTTVSPRPVQCRSGEPNDRELFGRVYRQARCATSCLEPDEWFPLTGGRGAGPGTGLPGHRDLRRVSSAGGLPGAAAPSAGWSVQSLKTGAAQLPGRFLTLVAEARDL